MTKTGAQILWECLEREGVRHVFGYPGGAILPAYDALKHSKIHHVLVRHEQGATHMADGYARASGGVGVAVATSGPGATNMVTGIATAMLDSSPVVCITGQVGSKLIGSDAFQETDITGVTLPITKHNYLVTHASEVARTIREAFYVARSGRPGPVLVDITKDAQQSSCEFDWEAAKPQLPGYRPDLSPAPKEYEQALELIHKSRRPVIFVGHGVIVSGAMAEVREFAEKSAIPVALTLLGLGAFPASHPLNLGMMGMHGEAWVNHAIQEADLLLAFGMRFDDRVTGNLKTYAQNAKKIHVEIDPAEINKTVKVDVALVGDLREVLRELLPKVEKVDRADWLHAIDELKGDSAVHDIQNLPDSGHLYAAHVINDLWRETRGQNTVVVTDVGQHQMWEAQYYKHEEPRSLITSGGLGTMGFALPAAIGAKVARPEAEVWVVVGDGGFQMTLCELATMVQEKLKVHIAIINNGYLGMVRQWQEFFYEKNYQATPLLNPDFVKLAEAYGVRSMKVTERAQVVPAVQAARKHDGPVLIDFQVEQEDSVFPMVPAGAALHEMIRRPSPIVETAADE
jgi:acetolactate synthase-1/2/3 large subunit